MTKNRMLVIAGLCLYLPMILAGAGKSAVQVAGLRIVGPGYGLNGSELRAFSQQSGTTLALVVQAPDNKKIIEVDDDKCTLEAFTDDRGHSLLDGIDWGAFPKISEDGRFALIEVESKVAPLAEAVRLRAKGSVRVRVAASEITVKIKALKMTVGAKAAIGQEVVQVMKAVTEDDGLTLVLQVKRKLVDDMKEIRFSTTAGEPVEIWGQSSFTFGNTSQMEYNIDMKSVPEALNVEMDLWEKPEILNLSFEIESGLGL
ncbi:hypothetical protein JW948_16580 [bacterium]|nr:hypothetical protein [bacterium]